MAKTYKFSEEQLLEAVVRYAELHRGKIEATKLAAWASENIEGLEGVEARHFIRPGSKTNTKTGKTAVHRLQDMFLREVKLTIVNCTLGLDNHFIPRTAVAL